MYGEYFVLYAVWHRYKINFQHKMNSVKHINFQTPCYSLADFSSIVNLISSQYPIFMCNRNVLIGSHVPLTALLTNNTCISN